MKVAANRAASLIDPKALMGIRNLELRARAVVEGFRSGLHRSPYHGFSVEFTEYRDYSPGDEPRHLDWRVYARTDRHFVKKFEDETNLRCHLAVDRSRSMAFGGKGVTKDQYAATLAATLAFFLHLQGDAVGLVAFDESAREFIPARHRPGHLRRLMLALEKPPAGSDTQLASALDRILTLAPKRGLIIFISDCLAPLSGWERSLGSLAAAGHEAAVFQVLDPAETSFDFPAAAVFRDLETGRTLFVDPAAARADYRQRLTAHNDALRGVCARLGVSHHSMTTDQPIELGLLAFLEQRSRRRGRVQGRTVGGTNR